MEAIEVLNAYGVTNVVAIGCCTGARLGIRLANRHNQRVRAMVLLNGGCRCDQVCLRK